MFPNLRAEQARIGCTDQEIATYLGITIYSYRQKRKKGTFIPKEIFALCKYFNKRFDYLFAENLNNQNIY